VQLWWQQLLLIFTVKHSKMWLGPIPHRAAAPCVEFFSWGSHYHCLMEVGAYAAPINAPVSVAVSGFTRAVHFLHQLSETHYRNCSQ